MEITKKIEEMFLSRDKEMVDLVMSMIENESHFSFTYSNGHTITVTLPPVSIISNYGKFEFLRSQIYRKSILEQW